jgi:hypothetical protein
MASPTHLLLIQFIYLTAQPRTWSSTNINKHSTHLNFPNHPVLSKYTSLAFNMSDEDYGYYSDGYNEGYDDGYDNGYGDGYDDGYDDGCGDGHDDGYGDGHGDGYDDGYSHGQSDGYQDQDARSNGGYEDEYSGGYQYERSDGYPDNSHSSDSYSTGDTYKPSSQVNLPDHPPQICV